MKIHICDFALAYSQIPTETMSLARHLIVDASDNEAIFLYTML